MSANGNPAECPLPAIRMLSSCISTPNLHVRFNLLRASADAAADFRCQLQTGFYALCHAGVAQVDAHTTVMTIVSATYVSVPFGLGCAATIRVGNLLGAGQGAQAQLAGIAFLLLCLVLCTIELSDFSNLP